MREFPASHKRPEPGTARSETRCSGNIIQHQHVTTTTTQHAIFIIIPAFILNILMNKKINLFVSISIIEGHFLRHLAKLLDM